MTPRFPGAVSYTLTISLGVILALLVADIVGLRIMSRSNDWRREGVAKMRNDASLWFHMMKM